MTIVLADSLPKTDQRLVSVRGTAELYGGANRRTIYRWADARLIPQPVKVGGRTFFRLAEIVSHIKAGCPPCRPPKRARRRGAAIKET
jgi:predicted DNA-binding transcriptional regulator AlpA